MKLPRKSLLWSTCIIAAWLAFCSITGIVASDSALHPIRSALTPDDEKRAVAIAESHSALLQQVDITANDGAILRAWNIRPASGNGDAVILLHGMANNRAGMLGQAD